MTNWGKPKIPYSITRHCQNLNRYGFTDPLDNPERNIIIHQTPKGEHKNMEVPSMVQKIGDLLPKQEKIFEDTEFVEAGSLVNKTIVLHAFALRHGASGEFFVIKCEDGNKLVSFSCGGKVIMDKLNGLVKHFGLTCDTNEVYVLPEAVEGNFVQTYTKDKKFKFYDLVS